MGRVSQSFAGSASVQNYIHYDITLLMLLNTLAITLLYTTITTFTIMSLYVYDNAYCNVTMER